MAGLSPLPWASVPLAQLGEGGSQTVLTIATFNLRCDTREDHAIGQGWSQRQGLVADIFTGRGCDIVGTQEGLPHQLRGLDKELACTAGEQGFRRVGCGRGWLRGGEHCAVYFRPEVLELVQEGTFGLSDRPECLGRRAWGAACPRIATYALLRVGGGSSLLVLNAHLDHVSAEARAEGAALLARRAAELEEEAAPSSSPVAGTIVLGDFNCAQQDVHGRAGEVFSVFLAAGFQSASEVASGILPRFTFHAWEGEAACGPMDGNPHRHIDWILWRGPRLLPRRFEVPVARGLGGVLPSDHFPVIAEFAVLPPMQ